MFIFIIPFRVYTLFLGNCARLSFHQYNLPLFIIHAGRLSEVHSLLSSSSYTLTSFYPFIFLNVCDTVLRVLNLSAILNLYVIGDTRMFHLDIPTNPLYGNLDTLYSAANENE